MDWLQWLNINSGAVTAMASAAVVVVTTIYAYFTIRLWQATKTQAEITRLIFEAGHRPYVSVMVRQLIPFIEECQGHLKGTVVIENHGSVPAAITAWDIQGRLMNNQGHEQPVKLIKPIIPTVDGCLAPHMRVTIKIHLVGSDLPHNKNKALPALVHGHIDYQGLGPQVYRTNFEAKDDGRLTQGYTMT